MALFDLANIWAAWDGGNYVVVGAGNTSDKVESDRQPQWTIAIAARDPASSPANEWLIDAFVSPRRAFIRTVRLPPGATYLSVLSHDVRGLQQLRAFELDAKVEAKARQLIGLTTRIDGAAHPDLSSSHASHATFISRAIGATGRFR